MDESPFDKRVREFPDLPRSLGRRRLVGGALMLVFSAVMHGIGTLKNMPALHRMLADGNFSAAILYVEGAAKYDAVVLGATFGGVLLLMSGVSARMGMSRAHFEYEILRRNRALELRVRDLEERVESDGI
jgi:hypothetical protein